MLEQKGNEGECHTKLQKGNDLPRDWGCFVVTAADSEDGVDDVKVLTGRLQRRTALQEQ